MIFPSLETIKKLSPEQLDDLIKAGFPIHLYDPKVLEESREQGLKPFIRKYYGLKKSKTIPVKHGEIQLFELYQLKLTNQGFKEKKHLFTGTKESCIKIINSS